MKSPVLTATTPDEQGHKAAHQKQFLFARLWPQQPLVDIIGQDPRTDIVIGTEGRHGRGEHGRDNKPEHARGQQLDTEQGIDLPGVFGRGHKLGGGNRREKHDRRADNIKGRNEAADFKCVAFFWYAVIPLDQGPHRAAPGKRVEGNQRQNIAPAKLRRGQVEEAFGRVLKNRADSPGLPNREGEKHGHADQQHNKLEEIGDRDRPKPAHKGVEEDDDPDAENTQPDIHFRGNRNKGAGGHQLDAIIDHFDGYALPGEELAQGGSEAGFEVFNRAVNAGAPPAGGKTKGAEEAGGNGDPEQGDAHPAMLITEGPDKRQRPRR